MSFLLDIYHTVAELGFVGRALLDELCAVCTLTLLLYCLHENTG